MSSPTCPTAASSAAFDPAMSRALRLLLQAHDYAHASHYGDWDFAVDIAEVRLAGAGSPELRWLLCQRYVEHAQETTAPTQAQRTFEPLTGLALPDRACFVLTRTGVALARTVAHHSDAVANGSHPLPDEVPYWDAALGDLWLSNLLVKRVRQPAPVMRLVLAAFQEQGWPHRIDNPIPPDPDKDDYERLHDLSNRLNNRQVHRLLHFRCDGMGEGICWERIVLRLRKNGHHRTGT